jgi:hypothetical protein
LLRAKLGYQAIVESPSEGRLVAPPIADKYSFTFVFFSHPTQFHDDIKESLDILIVGWCSTV